MKNKNEVILKVSSDKSIGYHKRVAGAMSWQLRDSGYVKARAIGPLAINSAIKAIATCNKRVSVVNVVLCVDLCFDTAKEISSKSASAVSMLVREVDTSIPDINNFIHYRVSGQKGLDLSGAKMKLAEAIAGPAREGQSIKLQCIGPMAIYKAVFASALAGGLIFPEGLLPVVVPSWGSIVSENGHNCSMINIDFWAKRKS